MEDLAGKINDLLSSPEGMQQLNSLASMLGLGGGAAAPNATAPAPQANTGNPLQGLDLSSLAGLLGGAGGNIPSAGDSSNSGSGAAPLASLLSGLGGGGTGGGNPLGALSGLLGGNGVDGDTIWRRCSLPFGKRTTTRGCCTLYAHIWGKPGRKSWMKRFEFCRCFVLSRC